MMAVPFLLTAQTQKVGNLTVFSEDGDKFYLILNGEKQNNVPQANLRIEELPQPYYNAKVIFADSTIMPISKNNLMLTDADGTLMDVTYKIKKDKANKAKMNYYSAIEVQRDYIPPAGVSVYQFGRPAAPHMGAGITTTTTTTTTTTDAVSASVSMNGISMNVAVSDPGFTETTTTTTANNTVHDGSNNTPTRNGCNGWAMNTTDFAASLKTISNSSFEDSKLSTAKNIASKNCLSSEQVSKICKLFNFEESKLAFAKYAYNRTTDQKNYFKVNDVFTFDSSKEELNNFVSGE